MVFDTRSQVEASATASASVVENTSSSLRAFVLIPAHCIPVPISVMAPLLDRAATEVMAEPPLEETEEAAMEAAGAAASES